jgi:ABC-type multidrug transport system fused ATPase/permease subunit
VAKNVQCRYRETTPIVLKGINFSIKSKEKVGVVGRTGSGKSTLILALKRILELEESTNGDGTRVKSSIEVSGVDIASIGLTLLRRSIELIPQDPFLLEGTIRHNLDPYKQFKDEQLIEVLNKTTVMQSLISSVSRKANAGEKVKDAADSSEA